MWGLPYRPNPTKSLPRVYCSVGRAINSIRRYVEKENRRPRELDCFVALFSSPVGSLVQNRTSGRSSYIGSSAYDPSLSSCVMEKMDVVVTKIEEHGDSAHIETTTKSYLGNPSVKVLEAGADLDKRAERVLKLKSDLLLLPIMSLTYLVAYLVSCSATRQHYYLAGC